VMGSNGQVRVPGRGLCVRTRPGVPGADAYELGHRAWGREWMGQKSAVEVCVSRLRRRLGGSVIETLRGRGYRLGRALQPWRPPLPRRDPHGRPPGRDQGTPRRPSWDWRRAFLWARRSARCRLASPGATRRCGATPAAGSPACGRMSVHTRPHRGQPSKRSRLSSWRRPVAGSFRILAGEPVSSSVWPIGALERGDVSD